MIDGDWSHRLVAVVKKHRTFAPKRLLTVFVLSCATSELRSAPSSLPRDDFWVPDGPVNAVVETNGVVYIGGRFDYISPLSTTLRSVDIVSGLDDAGFPKVNGEVKVVHPDNSGGWFVGGLFESIGGISLTNLAHVRADGSIDPDWMPNPDKAVLALVASDSVLYVGGKFTRIGGQDRGLLAAVAVGTGAALPWRADAVSGYSAEQAAVKAMVLSGGTLYVAGFFSAINGVLRDKIASLDPATGAVSDWNPNFTDKDIVRSPALRYEFSALSLSWNTVYLGGDFTVLGTFQSNAPRRNFIAALDTTKNLFESFTSWNPDADGPVTCMVVFCDTVFVGGAFTRIGGQARNHIAALDARTGLATDWNPNANGNVLAIAILGETVFVGGKFSRIGGESRSSLAALDIRTGKATPWNPKNDYAVSGLAISGGRVVSGDNWALVDFLAGIWRLSMHEPESPSPGPRLRPVER